MAVNTKQEKKLKKYIPPGTKEIYSPFFGSGSFEIYLANDFGMRVIACDNNLLLINFFDCIKEDKKRLIDTTQNILGSWDKEQYMNAYYAKCHDDDKYLMAAKYHLMLRSAMHARIYRDTAYSPTRLDPPNRKYTFKTMGFWNWCDQVNKISFDNITIKHQDYSVLITEAIKKNALIYLDPPYDFPENYYGWKDTRYDLFNHQKLHDQIKDYGNFILSYNNTEYIRNLYKDFTYYFPKWHQGARPNNDSNEILILGPKIAEWYKNHVDILSVLNSA